MVILSETLILPKQESAKKDDPENKPVFSTGDWSGKSRGSLFGKSILPSTPNPLLNMESSLITYLISCDTKTLTPGQIATNSFGTRE
jgi:hypothetical protein